MEKMRLAVMGVNEKCPLLDGTMGPYINFDNAASTPALQRVWKKVSEYLNFYSSIHRGTGFKSRLSSFYFEEARKLAGEFVGYSEQEHAVIFGKNATEAINKLSYRLRYPDNPVIIVSEMEHHSNDLPWRQRGCVIHTPVKEDTGTLDMDALRRLVDKHKDNLFLVAVTGASNVTGVVNPLGEIAKIVHHAGASLMVDAAQLVPHRRVSMGKPGEVESIDFLTYSAHKMYAPFGAGVLIARRDLLEEHTRPEYSGGGTVKIVSLQEVEWESTPHVDEAGSPNVVGVVALAEAIRFFMDVGYGKLEAIESSLTEKFLSGVENIPEIEILGPGSALGPKNRLGVVPFNITGMSHGLVAAVLAYEYGIGVRNGCFCAHPYIKKLTGVRGKAEKELVEAVRGGDKSDIPGAVRISFGFYNEDWEVDRLLRAVREIIARRDSFLKRYVVRKSTGEYFPANHNDNFRQIFSV